jgi:threonine 3-dehydrogenase
VGCGLALNPSCVDVAAVILEATGGVGADAIIEASGSVVALEGAFRLLRKGGRCALIGLPSAPVRLNLGADVIFKEATIIGIHGREMFRTWTRMQELLESGLLNVEAVATHEMPLSNFAEALTLLDAGEGGKVILVP